MQPRTPYIRTMFLASLLSWFVLVAMPVVNAHNQPVGVWASLCTLSGFKLVKLADGQTQQFQHDTHGQCPIGLFSLAHADDRWLDPGVKHQELAPYRYHFTPQGWEYAFFITRAPPVVITSPFS